jgi:hypothetical protein
MEDYIMRKFTILTLMMILGMSSVSFGKSYLCIPSQGVGLGTVGRGDWIISKEILVEKRYIVKTEGNNTKLKSVKEFGSLNSLICNDINPEKLMNGGNYLSCRETVPISEGGYTYLEFNFNFMNKEFNFYYMDLSIIRTGNVYSGKCEEI